MSAEADWSGIISQLIFTAFGLFILILFFWIESLILRDRRKQIPLCICITGARGKSSVTRLLVAVLRNAGYSVLAKTTGSKPVILLPDGTEKEIKRRGLPFVSEQKKVIKAATSHGVQALVVEMMSNGDVQVINASKYFCSEESNEIQIAGNRLCLRNAYRAKMFLNPVMGSATRIRFFVDIIPRAINQL